MRNVPVAQHLAPLGNVPDEFQPLRLRGRVQAWIY